GAAAERSGFQHGLESTGQSTGNRGKVPGRTQDSDSGRADQLLDLSSLMDGMRAHDHDDEHLQHEHDSAHEHDAHEGELTGGEHKLDLAAVRAKLATKTGKQYWRT